MHFKKYLVNTYIRAFFHLKNLGILFFVPLIMINILIPALNYLEYTRYGVGEELNRNILQYSQWFMPLASVWWPMFVLRDYIEGDGNELLYVNQNRNKLKDISCLFAIIILNIIIIFIIYTSLIPNMKYECIKIISICIFYFGIVYSTSFLTKSSTITLLLIILLAIANVYYGRKVKPHILIYYSVEALTRKTYFSIYLPFLIIGIVLTGVGVFLNKKMLKFGLGE